MKEKDKRVELRLPAKEKEQLEQLARQAPLHIRTDTGRIAGEGSGN